PPAGRGRLGDHRRRRGGGRPPAGHGHLDPIRTPAGAGGRVAARRAAGSRRPRPPARAPRAGPPARPPRSPPPPPPPPPLRGPPRAPRGGAHWGGAALVPAPREGSYPAPSAAGGATGAARAAGGSPRETWPAGGPAEIAPLRKAAIVLVSLEQSLASQLLSH